MKNRNFIGRDKILAAKRAGLSRKLVAFQMEDKSIPRQHCKIFAGDEEIGEVTSGTKSPSLAVGIGMGYVKAEYSKVTTEIQIEIRKKRGGAIVVAPPFYKEGTVRIKG